MKMGFNEKYVKELLQKHGTDPALWKEDLNSEPMTILLYMECIGQKLEITINLLVDSVQFKLEEVPSDKTNNNRSLS